jgi:Ran GTPase-activating protein (RanGAP) involved in mRNA processing and transport
MEETNPIFESVAGRIIPRGMRCLDLSTIKISQKDAHTLRTVMAATASLQALVLRYCGLASEQLTTILQGIQECRVSIIGELDLANNLVGNEGAEVLAANLRDNGSKLQRINIAHNSIGSEGASALAVALALNTTLRCLNLSGNRVAQEGAEALAVMVSKNRFLVHLDLSSNGVQGAVVSMGRSLAQNEALQRLDLGRDHLTAAGFQAVAQSLASNTALRVLDLSGVGLGRSKERDHVEPLAAILHSRFLTHLILSHNDLRDHGATAVAKSLATNRSLRFLDISGNLVREEGVRCLCNAISKHPRLVVWKLGALNELGAQLAVASLLQQNTTLQCLDLSLTAPLGRAYYRDWHLAPIMHALRANTTLQSIRLRNNHGSKSALNALARALRANTHLSEIDLSVSTSHGVAAMRPQDCISLLAITKALQESPRYHSLCLAGIHLSRASSCVVPLCASQTGGARPLSDHDIVAYLQKTHFDKAMAFTMGQHAKLGAGSSVRTLMPDSVDMIVLCFFDLPFDYFNRPRTAYGEYRRVLDAVAN